MSQYDEEECTLPMCVHLDAAKHGCDHLDAVKRTCIHLKKGRLVRPGSLLITPLKTPVCDAASRVSHSHGLRAESP
ncbi:hypothetical protein TNCV_784141 [Trichonephila clavipes]|nr:hypothetical protein TNCV_784141 [Trichonephila clavipes]